MLREQTQRSVGSYVTPETETDVASTRDLEAVIPVEEHSEEGSSPRNLVIAFGSPGHASVIRRNTFRGIYRAVNTEFLNAFVAI
jgi:hypothetical protein